MVQRNDRDAAPKRARFNSSLLDANVVEKGTEFKDLPETFVIFITENDVLGKGLPLYTVDRIIDNIVQRERKQDKIDTALRMIEKGIFTVEQIAEISTLSLEEVEELIKKRSA